MPAPLHETGRERAVVEVPNASQPGERGFDLGRLMPAASQSQRELSFGVRPSGQQPKRCLES